MSLPLFLQQCPACLAYLIWMVFKMGGRDPYSCCFVGCYLQDLFNTALSILVQLPSSFLPIRLVSIHTAVLTQLLLGKNCALFYLIGLTSI